MSEWEFTADELSKDYPSTYTYSRQYFSNQLVSTYKDKFKCIAQLEENGKITWKTTPNLMLKGDIVDGKIISIKPSLCTKYHCYEVMTVKGSLEPGHSGAWEAKRFFLRSEDISKDILDTGWEGASDDEIYSKMILVKDTRKLLPKLPHYLNVLFGGKMTIEEEHTYDREGKITDTQYRVLQVINRQNKNPLVKKCKAQRYIASDSYTIEVK